MKTVKVTLPTRGHSYLISIRSDGFAHSLNVIKKNLHEKKLFVISTGKIKKLHGKKITKAFGRTLKLVWILVNDSEQNKTLSTCEKILAELSKKGAHRKSMLLALGGGVIGDMTGFVAAIYMRGIPYFQMPTTLLSQVDSSIGGKTGVDLKTGKNLAGAFHQPRAVFIHTDFLKTLPAREIKCGLAEIIKHSIIADKVFFDFLNKNSQAILNLNPSILEKIIYRSCQIKAQIVAKDEKENHVRATLNFGHTLGHAIETLSRFQNIKHGEAVAMGMVYAAKLAHKMTISDKDYSVNIENVLKKFGLPTKIPAFDKRQYQKALARDKKSGGKTIKFILVKKIGKVSIVPLSIGGITRSL